MIKEVVGTILAGLIVGYMLLSVPIETLKAFGVLPRDGFEDD